MINLAGKADCDVAIAIELELAGISILRLPVAANREVPSAIVGMLSGWTFRRAWYYWVAKADSGVALPFSLAEPLYQSHGQVVRVSGDCACRPPRTVWYKEPWHLGVPFYHVDTQLGLIALAAALRSVGVAEETLNDPANQS